MDLRTIMPKEPDFLCDETGSEHKRRAMGGVYWAVPHWGIYHGVNELEIGWKAAWIAGLSCWSAVG